MVLLICAFPLAPAPRLQEAEKTTPSTPDASPPKPSNLRVRMDAKIMDKQLKRKVSPAYPQEARDHRIQGTVRLHVIVGTDGKVLQVEVVSGHPLLAEAAIEAVRKREYQPVLINGVPVEVDTTVDTVFSLLY
jgi:protein TonB